MTAQGYPGKGGGGEGGRQCVYEMASETVMRDNYLELVGGTFSSITGGHTVALRTKYGL